mgnify:CR=1 FL=1
MGEYNKSIKELLNDFENLQLIETVKQVNVQSGVTTRSVESQVIMNKVKLPTLLETLD